VILSVMGDATSIIIRTRLGLTCVAIASFVTTGSMCVTGKGKVTRIGLLILGEAGSHKSRVARFAVLEVCETPPTTTADVGGCAGFAVSYTTPNLV
jgi:hypothetical protein